jgi:hypothetical protein
MFRSTEGDATPGVLTTPYFMLIQMNNAALLEAYATLGISPAPAKIEERAFPAGFSMEKALAGIPFGQEDVAQHPGHIHQDAADPIAEAEGTTQGTVTATLSLGRAVAGRFASNSGDGGAFSALIDKALAAAALGSNFDDLAAAIGGSVIGVTAGQSSIVPDGGGAGPFAGLRPDYRPETAPNGPQKTTASRRSFEAAHVGSVNVAAVMAATFDVIAQGRRRGAGTGRAIRPARTRG